LREAAFAVGDEDEQEHEHEARLLKNVDRPSESSTRIDRH